MASRRVARTIGGLLFGVLAAAPLTVWAQTTTTRPETPLDHVRAGSVGLRAPGLWIQDAIAFYTKRHAEQITSPGPVGATVPPPSPGSQVTEALGTGLVTLFQDVLRAWIAAAVPPGGLPQSFTDLDSDGIRNRFDNCPTVANPDQADANSNGVGDACDTAP